MHSQDLRDCLHPAADAALAIAPSGLISYANPAAEQLLGWPASKFQGAPCAELLAGVLPDGARLCALDCPILLQAISGHAVPAFDLEARTASGHHLWLNVSTLPVRDGDHFLCLHLLRDATRQMRLQLAAQNFAQTLLDSPPAPPLDPPPLTDQEQRIVDLLSLGHTTRYIADQLAISPTTVRNHIQHLMRKLNVHSRIEAVLRTSHRLARPGTPSSSMGSD